MMERALALAKEAALADEVPVGAVIAFQGHVIGEGSNLVQTREDPTAHAEMIAINAACRTLAQRRLTGANLYVTLEPCAMCAGAIVLARISRVFFGARDPKAGALETLYAIGSDDRLNHRIEVTGGLLAEPCSRLLTRFFQKRR